MSSKNSQAKKIKTPDKKNPFKLFLVAAVLIVVLAGGGMYYLTVNGTIAFQTKEPEKFYCDLGEYTVNVVNDQSTDKKYLLYDIFVGYNKGDKKAKKQLTKDKKLPVINDIVNGYFQEQTYAFLNNPDNKAEIKETLLKRINEEVTDVKITDIRIAKYLLQ